MFQLVGKPSSKAKPRDERVGDRGAAADDKYCADNPTPCLNLGPQGRPKARCGWMEKGCVSQAAPAPGLKMGGGPLLGSPGSTASALLHPSFLYRGPRLHTLYGCLAAATALLITGEPCS